MSVNISYFAGAGTQFFDNNGVPLAGGKLYTYLAGTTNPEATYTDNTGLTANTNPVILDSSGRTAEIWLTGGIAYKFLLKDANDVQLGSYDNIEGINDLTISDSALNEFITKLASPTGATLVGFQQEGSTVASTVDAKIKQYVDIKDFGAKGDGVADDTDALQAFFNSAQARAGTTHWVSKGTYNTTKQIAAIQTSNVIIRGAGATVNDKAPFVTGTVIKYIGTPTDQPFLAIYACDNITFTGVGFDCNNGSVGGLFTLVDITNCNLDIIGAGAKSSSLYCRSSTKNIENNIFNINAMHVGGSYNATALNFDGAAPNVIKSNVLNIRLVYDCVVGVGLRGFVNNQFNSVNLVNANPSGTVDPGSSGFEVSASSSGISQSINNIIYSYVGSSKGANTAHLLVSGDSTDSLGAVGTQVLSYECNGIVQTTTNAVVQWRRATDQLSRLTFKDWTPTVTSSAGVTGITIDAKYSLIGTEVLFSVTINVASGLDAGGWIDLTVPDNIKFDDNYKGLSVMGFIGGSPNICLYIFSKSSLRTAYVAGVGSWSPSFPAVCRFYGKIPCLPTSTP